MLKKINVTITLYALTFLLGLGLPACRNAAQPMSSAPQLADEIVIYSWAGETSTEIYDQFTAEYGVQIRIAEYESQEEAISNMREGQVFDLVVMENVFIPGLVAEGLLAQLDRANIPNFKYVPASFRDLIYDPGNLHTIPYSWGTTGLLVRTDLIEKPVSRWRDMWDPAFAGKVVNWKVGPRYVLGTALMALGYSANSENPAELAAALDYLRQLEPDAIWLVDNPTISPYLLDGTAVLGVGWALDYWEAIAENENIAYILPEEGTLLWGDNWVIPANSPHKYTAELFLNFFLRPEIAAQFVNELYYPVANEGIAPYLNPEVANDEVIFPSNQNLINAEFIFPLSPAGSQLWDETWEQFLQGQ